MIANSLKKSRTVTAEVIDQALTPVVAEATGTVALEEALLQPTPHQEGLDTADMTVALGKGAVTSVHTMKAPRNTRRDEILPF